MLGWSSVYLVSDSSHVVGNYNLLEEPPQDQVETCIHLRGGDDPLALDLRNQVYGAFDRTGHQLGEEGNV